MALKYLLDTNICIYIARQHPLSVLHKFEQHTIGEAGMSTITYGELYYSAQKSHYISKTLLILEKLINIIPVFPISTKVAEYYGEVRSWLEKNGRIIGNNDLWIASHALDLKITLVTNNVKKFARIPRLKIENWLIKTRLKRVFVIY